MGQGKVLITGATGLVAGQCIKELLAHGYDVRGTVRAAATSDVSYLRPLADGDDRGALEFAEATLDSDAGWAEAASGCDYLLHVASPIPFKAPKNEDEIIRPTVEGTKRVLRAAATAGVRRIVYTSSTDTLTHNSATAGRVRTEEDWSDPAECWVYAKSKLLAERFAWEFAAQHPDGPEVAVVIPGAVIGPPLQSRKASSADIIRRMLAGQMPVVPRIGLAYSDVRDLAVAHRRPVRQSILETAEYLISAGIVPAKPQKAA